jgi:acid stress-induced BolA-like protein IbaG/YrbA
MEVNVENLQSVFASPVEQDQSIFERDGATGRYSGFLIRRDFRRVATSERQKWIWKVLRDNFGDESVNVSLILAFSPEEWKEAQEDIASAS